MDLHGLGQWTIRWVNTRNRAGQCKHRERELNFSTHLMRAFSDEEAMDTITHEIAHALVGPGHKHDYVWQRQHRALGGSGKEHWDNREVSLRTAKWHGVCVVSQQTVYAMNRLTTARRQGTTPCKCHRKGVRWVPNN